MTTVKYEKEPYKGELKVGMIIGLKNVDGHRFTKAQVTHVNTSKSHAQVRWLEHNLSVEGWNIDKNDNHWGGNCMSDSSHLLLQNTWKERFSNL